MIRRCRRRARDYTFSLDSFLDVVANVVGIIIRLILVVWVSARSYSSLLPVLKPSVPFNDVSQESPEPEDPLQKELAVHRQEMAQARDRLLQQLRQLQLTQDRRTQAEQRLAALAIRRQGLVQDQANLDRAINDSEPAREAVLRSSAELGRRRLRLQEEIRAVERLGPAKQTLFYRTPVSRPVYAEELLFECRQGRVAFVDLAALLAEVRRGLDEKGKLLRSQWQVSDTAGPVGSFRLRYTIERERSPLDALIGAAGPDTRADFRYGLSEWELEPVDPVRGESAEAALTEGSAFRHVVEGLAPQAVVTFFVYPDSFALYRRLRDFLHERDVEVAGRPLPEGLPITGSRRGSLSRGQ
jgi:hypothetical protein